METVLCERGCEETESGEVDPFAGVLLSDACIQPGIQTIEKVRSGEGLKILSQKTICLSVTIRQMGRWRKGDMNSVETMAEKSSLGIRKKVIAAESWDKLLKISSEINIWLGRIVIPSFFQRGTYLLPLNRVAEVHAYLKSARERQARLLDEFLEVYPEAVEDARRRLSDQFHEKNYPRPEVLRKRFAIEWNFMEFSTTPSSIQELNSDIYEEQRERYSGMFDEVLKNAGTFLRAEMAEVVNTLVTELTPSPEGNQKRLYGSVVERFTNFLDYFQDRNLTNDTELEELVNRARNVIKGVSMEELRDKDGSVRTIVQQGLQCVSEVLKQPGFVQEINRVYDFTDEV